MLRLLTLTLAAALTAHAALDDWQNLQALRPGERVWIIYRDGNSTRHRTATAASWTESALTIRHKRSEVVISRADLVKVSTYAGKSRAKGAAMGALIGAAAGATFFGVAAATDDFFNDSIALVAAGGAILFGGVGAVVGLAAGSTKTQTIYQVK
ncbi:MAG: hypothetical protein ABI972_14950 [Acidobacteriota bacterium]